MSNDEMIGLPFNDDDPFYTVSFDLIDNSVDNEDNDLSERDYHLMNSVAIGGDGDNLDHHLNTHLGLYPSVDQSSYNSVNNNGETLNEGGELCGEDGQFPQIDELPKTIHSCYIINAAYRILLLEFKSRLEDKLQANLEMQEELMNSEALANEFVHPNSFLKFLAPYFRDNKNFTPDDNEDTKSRKASGSINIFYLRLKKPWKDSDKLDLKVAVQNYVTKKDMEPYTRRENRLLEEIKQLELQGASPEIISAKCDTLDDQRREIESIQTASTLPPREHSSDIDWLEVSQFCPSIYSEFDCEIQWTNCQHPDINHGVWSTDEEDKLKSLVTCDNPDWEKIAKDLGTQRVAWQCCKKYQSDLNEKMLSSGPFTKQETDLLKKLIAKLSIGSFIPWHQVCYFMEKRTLAQIKHFWDKTQSCRSRVKWSELENEVLVAAVQKVGTSWIQVANYIPGRTNRQCRERYMMRLGIKDRKLGDWSFSEDLKLVNIAPDLKFRWVDLMAHLTKRNARQIAARYDTIERCKIAKAIETSKDLRDLVPRNKSCLKVNFPQLHLKDGQTIDEFLREGRKELENDLNNYRREVNRNGIGGRRRKPESEELIEQELVRRFSLYSLMGNTSKPSKPIARAGQESMVFDVLEKILKNYFSGHLPSEPHLLAKVISSVLKKQVIGLDPDRLNYCPPIFPPNIITTRSYQVLLYMRQTLEQQLTDYTFDTSQHIWHPQYKSLIGLIVSLYFWPCLLSKQKPTSTKPPLDSILSSSSSSSTTTATTATTTLPTPSAKKSSKKRKKSQTLNIEYCNDSREKQRRLFTDYEEYLSKSN